MFTPSHYIEQFSKTKDGYDGTKTLMNWLPRRVKFVKSCMRATAFEKGNDFLETYFDMTDF